MATRTNFSFRYEWSEKIAHLSETIQYQIFIGTVAYAKHGEFPADASAEARAAFEEYILPDFIKRAKAAEYRARAKARKAAAQTATQTGNTTARETPAAETPATEAPAAVGLAVAPPLSRAARRRLAREQKKHKLPASLQKQ